MEDDFKDFRSELDGLYKETKELRIKLKSEKDRHKVEMEEMMTQFGETEFTCKLEGPTAVTLSLTSAAKKEYFLKLLFELLLKNVIYYIINNISCFM